MPAGAETPAPPKDGSQDPATFGPPDASDMAQILDDGAQSARERTEWLQSPEAIQQREASRSAFEDLGDEGAKQTLEAQFADQLGALDGDPARRLSDVVLKEALSETVARVEVDGETQLLDSPFPVQARDESGKEAKVDLSLLGEGKGFVAENPLTEVSLPGQAADPVEVGGEGLALVPRGAEPAAAQRLGDKDLFYANAYRDADILVSPVTSGAEISTQLRSPQSPADLSYGVDLPKGAQLVSKDGAALVEREGETLGRISPPSAVDAQGVDVPVSMDVEGSSVTLHVDLPDEVAYPILVDPLLEWYVWSVGYANGLSDWWWTQSAGAGYQDSYGCTFTQHCWTTNGLYISSPAGSPRPAGSYGQFFYNVPGGYTSGAYISELSINPFNTDWNYHSPGTNCFNGEPHNYVGLWNGSGWSYVTNSQNQLISNPIQNAAGIWLTGPNGGGSAGSAYAKSLVFAPPNTNLMPRSAVIGMGVNGTQGFTACQRDLYAGAVAIWADDVDVPQWPWGVANASAPDEWIDQGSVPITSTAMDGGLGVKYYNLYRSDGTTFLGQWASTCTGAKSNPCRPEPPAIPSNTGIITNWSAASLPEGDINLRVRPFDVLVKPSATDATVTVHVDHTAPTVSTLAGPLVDTSNPLIGGSTFLRAILDDPLSGATHVQLRAGTSLQTLQDVEVADTPCDPAGGCQLDEQLFADLSEWDPGSYAYEITASDAAGNEIAPQTGTFTLDPNEPEIEVTGTLADADGAPMTTDTLSATIDSTDSQTGDSGIQRVETRVDDELVDTQTATCATSCPNSYTTGYTYDRRNWPPGPHEIEFRTFDRAGNTADTSLLVDTSSDPVQELCPATTPTVQTASNPPFDADDARSAAISGSYTPSVPPTDPDPLTGKILAPELVRDDFDSAAPLDAGESLAEGQVGSSPASGFGVADELCMIPRQTTSAETISIISHESTDEDNPVIADAAIYPNSAADTDTVVRPTALGVTVVQSIRGSNAPATYSWDLGISPDLQAQTLTGGGIAIYDPTVDVQTPVSVPTRPPGAEEADSIPDVTTQTAEAFYQVAQAENETGKLVYSVVANPYGVDSSGASSSATMTYANGVVTATPPSGSTALVLPIVDDARAYNGPSPVRAYYSSYRAPNAIVDYTGNKACTYRLAAAQGQHRRLLFNFGIAARPGSKYGVLLDIPTSTPTFIRNGQVIAALNRAVGNLRDPNCQSNSAVRVGLAYGASNQNIATHMSSLEARRHGHNMQGVLNLVERDMGITGADPVHLVVAEDTEAWGAPSLTIDWVQGSFGPHQVVDYGSAGNCQTSDVCRGGWNTSQFAFVSQGSTVHRIIVLPQIFHTFHIGNWRAIQAQWNGNHSRNYQFGGVTSVIARCYRAYGPQESYRAFHRKVARLGRELVAFPCPYGEHPYDDPFGVGD